MPAKERPTYRLDRVKRDATNAVVIVVIDIYFYFTIPFRRGQTAGVLEGVQVHRDVQRHPAQRRRAVGGRAKADSVARDSGQEDAEQPTEEGHSRVEDVAVVAHCQGAAAKDVSARLQIQILWEPTRALGVDVSGLVMIAFLVSPSSSICVFYQLWTVLPGTTRSPSNCRHETSCNRV